MRQRLPESPPLFPEDQVTDRSERFLAAELVREKLFRKLGEEIPYGLTVEIESFKTEGATLHIHALIWVEKSGHKPIVIGKHGALLKAVGRKRAKTCSRRSTAKCFCACGSRSRKAGRTTNGRCAASVTRTSEGKVAAAFPRRVVARRSIQNHWIPACAGMTARRSDRNHWISACAGMTAEVRHKPLDSRLRGSDGGGPTETAGFPLARG